MTSLIRNCILTAAVLVLPGCLAINALLGVAGFITTGPIQYAGTVYSVGEYAYEYAINDKNPVDVIEEKFAWLTGPEHDPRKEGHALALAKAATLQQESETVPVEQLTFASLEQKPSLSLAQDSPDTPEPNLTASLRKMPIKEAPALAEKPAPRKPARIAVKRVKQPRLKAAPPIIQAKAGQPGLPQHEYIEHPANPLQTRLDRLEQGLARAERLMNEQPVEGIRYSVAGDGGQSGTTLSGSWTIRHQIMQERPPAQRVQADETVPATAQLAS